MLAWRAALPCFSLTSFEFVEQIAHMTSQMSEEGICLAFKASVCHLPQIFVWIFLIFHVCSVETKTSPNIFLICTQNIARWCTFVAEALLSLTTSTLQGVSLEKSVDTTASAKCPRPRFTQNKERIHQLWHFSSAATNIQCSWNFLI